MHLLWQYDLLKRFWNSIHCKSVTNYYMRLKHTNEMTINISETMINDWKIKQRNTESDEFSLTYQCGVR